MRDDVHGLYLPPESVNIFLLRFGGKTPLGEPNYRLIHTACRWMKMGGLWNEWPDKANLQDRGGLSMSPGGILSPTGHKPIRQIPETREFLKYSHISNRWILERWCPAHMFGSREAWEKQTVPDHNDLLLLGPYPERGDYMMVSEPTEHVPEQTQLEQAIQNCEFQKSKHHASVEQAVIEAVNEAQEAYDKECEEFSERVRLQLMDVMIPTNRVSLAAGRHREVLAKRAGIRSHCGN